MRWIHAFAVGLLLAAGGSAGAGPDDKAATKPWSSADGEVTVSLPAEWTLTPVNSPDACAAWDAQLPAGAGAVSLTIFHLPGMLSARTQPFYERDVLPKNLGPDAVGHTETDPIPHLWAEGTSRGAPQRRTWIYRIVRRHGFTFYAKCAPALWPAVKDACFAAAASLTTKFDEWPKPPDGYKKTLRDGYEYYAHSAVKPADVDATHKLLREQQAAYEKIHGPLSLTPDTPLVVVLHANAADEATLRKGGPGAGNKVSEGRLFVILPKSDVTAQSEVAYDAWRAFHQHAFGGQEFGWIAVGEAKAATTAIYLGKPLPFIPESLQKQLPGGNLPNFDTLATLMNWSAEQVVQMFAYTAFFRLGPSPYREAYAAFLRDAAGGDFETAQKKNLLSLDQDKMRTAAIAWLGKELKVVARK